jgi:hypothetical protein
MQFLKPLPVRKCSTLLFLLCIVAVAAGLPDTRVLVSIQVLSQVTHVAVICVRDADKVQDVLVVIYYLLRAQFVEHVMQTLRERPARYYMLSMCNTNITVLSFLSSIILSV